MNDTRSIAKHTPSESACTTHREVRLVTRSYLTLTGYCSVLSLYHYFITHYGTSLLIPSSVEHTHSHLASLRVCPPLFTHSHTYHPHMSSTTFTNNSRTSSATNTSRCRDKTSGRYASTHKRGTRRCSVCGTSETSQWRTAPDGSPLCNKCGIKLHRGTLDLRKKKNKCDDSRGSNSRNNNGGGHRGGGGGGSSSERARQICSIRNITNPN